jgi:lipoate-protein ligase B
MLRARGADVIDIERGGDVTWHGPGQLVGYPILDLTRHRADLHWYLRTLEAALITALAEFDVSANRVTGKTGVWVGHRKIASLGVHVRRWVTLHGFALNVQPDLEWFTAIVPCGLAGVDMTSIARELDGGKVAETLMAKARCAVVRSLATVFDLVPEKGEFQQPAAPSSGSAKACDSASARPPFMPYG